MPGEPRELEQTAAATGAPIGRRLFLGIVGAGAVGVVLGSRLQAVVGDALSSLASPSGSGLASLIPGANRFRLYTVTGSFPEITRARFHLEVGGLVERPLVLDDAQLRALPRHEIVADFQCVTGWRVPKVAWAGARLSDVIDLAGPQRSAHALEFASSDGVYTESLTIDEARRADVLVAYEMLGAPITAGHGGPVRLYVAPMYGYKSIKWLSSIRLVGAAAPGYWERQGYAVQAWVGRSNGRHDAPIDA
ncbi:MAG: molybdopterin-dependent oxidoreductase [Actinomycetota bacterium]|nr:molybdopterin-dependent oxidoreductase [Actinomycetota bacterium]